MTRVRQYEHQFVHAIPERLDAGVLYISIEFTTAAHLCACGCGREVVTPIRPKDWQVTFDGETVSLSPSIGNWSFPCTSHYVIRRGQVRWAGDLTREEIDAGRTRDRDAKVFNALSSPIHGTTEKPLPPATRLQRLFRVRRRAR
jgi:hypothetical protein